ncbi:MAG: flagellar biosynthesis anti-sigma factor FlgM [Nitrosomonas sp.]|nr:flagellar biosynthesis anti-sigma factor FlgM [Nitrosomonas sp.]
MKIDNSIQSLPNVSANDDKKRTETSSATSTRPEKVNENSVHISQQASNLQSIDSTAASSSVVDMSRVQEIRQAISEGTFKVNPDVVADRLLETVQELIQSKEDRS